MPLTTMDGKLPLIVINNLEHLIIRKIKMEWISVKDRLPEEVSDQLYLDVWDGEERLINVEFTGGEFLSPIEDYQGDFSHFESVENVTHWLDPQPPKLK